MEYGPHSQSMHLAESCLEEEEEARIMRWNSVGRIIVLFLFLSYKVVVGDYYDRGGRLSYDIYHQSCPGLENIVRATLQSISLVDPTTPAAMLRLMFHDCQVQGCDASILVDSNNGEMGSAKNFGIRKREAISVIKSMVELACPRKVSCADILILAAREAVAIAGGPRIEVPLGRRDSGRPSSLRAADASLPPADVGVDGMLRLFASKGMTVEESVAIVGSHTLGVTHCLNLRSNQRSGLSRNTATMKSVNMMCPLGLGSSALDNFTFVSNDPTSIIFDNTYFVNAMSGHGVLRIDAEMPLDPRTAPFVRGFAVDEQRFFQAFSSAFVKLSSSNVLVGTQGVIRKTCNAFN